MTLCLTRSNKTSPHIHCCTWSFQIAFTMASSVGGTSYGNQAYGGNAMNYGPSRHGSSEQAPRGRFQPSSTVFGITPPRSRSGTPPRSSTRPARSSSRRRSRDDFSESRERARSREERRREQQVGGADEQQAFWLPILCGELTLCSKHSGCPQDGEPECLLQSVSSPHRRISSRI